MVTPAIAEKFRRQKWNPRRLIEERCRDYYPCVLSSSPPCKCLISLYPMKSAPFYAATLLVKKNTVKVRLLSGNNSISRVSYKLEISGDTILYSGP